MHQFDKVEMFSFCNPEKSKDEHEYLTYLVEEEILTRAWRFPTGWSMCVQATWERQLLKSMTLKPGYLVSKATGKLHLVQILPIFRQED